jgi:hypothetical protein
LLTRALCKRSKINPIRFAQRLIANVNQQLAGGEIQGADRTGGGGEVFRLNVYEKQKSG